MSEAVITLHGLTKRFAGMDNPPSRRLDCTIHSGYKVTGLVWMRRKPRHVPGLLSRWRRVRIGLRPDTKRQRAARGSGLYVAAETVWWRRSYRHGEPNFYADLRSVTGEIRKKTLPVC